MTEPPFITEVNHDNFAQRVVETSKRVPVLVDFWAAWCAPCQLLMPVLAKLANEYAGKFILAKVNTDENPELALEQRVRSLPTVRLFRNASPVGEFLGAQPESIIRNLLDAHVERDSDRIAAQAMDLHREGKSQDALALLEEALTSDSDNERVQFDLAVVALDSGNLQACEDTLKGLPPNRQFDADAKRLYARLHFARLAEDAPPTDTLLRAVADDPADCDARYKLSARKTMEGDYEAAMEQLLEILRRDRTFSEDAGRRGLVALFDILGTEHPLVSRYRSLMSSALY
jgi:putative thioredoxin